MMWTTGNRGVSLQVRALGAPDAEVWGNGGGDDGERPRGTRRRWSRPVRVSASEGSAGATNDHAMAAPYPSVPQGKITI